MLMGKWRIELGMDITVWPSRSHITGTFRWFFWGEAAQGKVGFCV